VPTSGRWWGEQESVIEPLVAACQRLSERRHGALIVLERDTGLQEYIETGVKIDAKVTPELLLTVFYVGTSLHDGAAIIRGTRLAAAACILPLSSSGTLTDRRMGLRHRAGLGISEVSDAVAVIVSEETGQISVAHNGRMIRRLDAQRLSTILHAFQQPRRPTPPWLGWLRRRSGVGGQGSGVGALMGTTSRAEPGAQEERPPLPRERVQHESDSPTPKSKEPTLQSTASGGGGE
jgi:diadenylate cyclase